ncbi:putative bifunctional diguanylate cyclase/phosphodiesterase [Streptomyces gilvus]|uniref:putative bifunctional diguanylate cyclase/phosphodiesterase n=1 Tax=Streptomyces gilvus TaxID=2920937 RepID=UPI001F0EEB23|nr:bifunctional diguanylate cyclase/phosphodiesterase [Streptomyces sp. CME 23]MCH5670810.1 bifunctional diguanylate cyclase/phosphodiesterase [Streptomyces sp. CME 23]
MLQTQRLMAAYLTAVVGLTCLYVSLPATHTVLCVVIGLCGTAAVLAGIRVHGPAHRWPWLMLAAGLLAFTVGDAYYNLRGQYHRASNPFPSVADAFCLAVYPLCAAGLLGLVHYRWVGRDLPSRLDALIVTTGLALPVWVYLVQPLATQDSSTWRQRVISIAYPVGGVLVLAILTRLVSPGVTSSRNRALQLVAVGTVTLLCLDIAYGILQLNVTWHPDVLLNSGRLVLYTAWGLAALHPSMVRLTEPAPLPESPRPQWPRLVLLTLATLIVPSVLLLEGRRGGSHDATVPAALSAVLFLLVMLRLASMIAAHRQAMAREQTLRTATASLVAAMTAQEIARACDTAVTALLGPDVPHRTLVLPAERAQELHSLLARSTDSDGPRSGALISTVDRLGPDIAGRLGGLPTALVCPVVHPDHPAGGELPDVLLAAGPERRLFDVRGSLEILASHAGLAVDRIALRGEIVRRESEAYFRTLVRNASDVILIVNEDTTVRYASPSALAVLGSSDLRGRRLRDLVDPQDRGRVDKTLATLVGDELHQSHDHWWVLRDGGHIEVEVRCRDLRADETVGGLIVTMRDVTEQRQLEHELTQRAFHDSVTGLPNRTLLLERTGRALLRGQREPALTCLLFIDLDDFKIVNDTLGHSAGDRLLRGVGERLTETLRRTDTAARLGGDEFAVLMEDAKQPLDAELLAAQVVQSLSRPFHLSGDSVSVSASVGVATALDTRDPEELLALADLALYAAKAAGKRRWRRFQPQLRTRMTERQGLRVRLDDALAQDEFALSYQPVVDIVSGHVVGFEALARWTHQQYGVVPPEQFIPLAEETGHITSLGAWVLHSAAADIARLQRRIEPSSPPYVSVNVSGRQWRDDGFLDEVARALDTPGLVPGSLRLELTESVLMQRDDQIDGVIRGLRNLGVRIAVDDFGTGFSSLRYLHDFPLDILKIDKSFIDDIPHDPRQVKLVEGIVRMAATLELEVVAEGIEAAAQRDLLSAMGCRYGQGFLFAEPMTVEEGEVVLRRDGRRPRGDGPGMTAAAAADGPVVGSGTAPDRRIAHDGHGRRHPRDGSA